MRTLGCQQSLQIPLPSLCLFNYAFLPLLSTCSSSNSIPTFPTLQILYYYSCYSTNMPAGQTVSSCQISTSVSDSRATETRACPVPSTQGFVPLSPGVTRLSLLRHWQQGYKGAVPAQKKKVFLLKWSHLPAFPRSAFPLSTTPCLCLTHIWCRDTSDWSTAPLALGHFTNSGSQGSLK